MSVADIRLFQTLDRSTRKLLSPKLLCVRWAM